MTEPTKHLPLPCPCGARLKEPHSGWCPDRATHWTTRPNLNEDAPARASAHSEHRQVLTGSKSAVGQQQGTSDKSAAPLIGHFGPISQWDEPGVIETAREQRGPRRSDGGHYDLCSGSRCPCFREGRATPTPDASVAHAVAEAIVSTVEGMWYEEARNHVTPAVLAALRGCTCEDDPRHGHLVAIGCALHGLDAVTARRAAERGGQA